MNAIHPSRMESGAARSAPTPTLRGAPQLQPRAYTVEPDTSWLRGYPETVFKLRCYGHGIGYVCDGQPCTYSGEGAEDFADERGRIWVKTGIIPTFQSAAI